MKGPIRSVGVNPKPPPPEITRAHPVPFQIHWRPLGVNKYVCPTVGADGQSIVVAIQKPTPSQPVPFQRHVRPAKV